MVNEMMYIILFTMFLCGGRTDVKESKFIFI